MMKRKIIVSLIVVSFLLLLASTIILLQKTRDVRRIDPLELEDLPKEDIIQHIYEKQSQNTSLNFFLIPVFGFFGVVVGLLIYYILGDNIEKKEELIRYNTDVILRLLNPQERKVIRRIVDEGGKVQQMQITYMEGFTKVKAHRILDALEKKGVLFKEKLGKMRLIKMKDEFYEILKDKN